MGLGALQILVLLAPIVIRNPINPYEHITSFTLLSSAGLLGMTAWLARLR
jgi:hypothetical protein